MVRSPSREIEYVQDEVEKREMLNSSSCIFCRGGSSARSGGVRLARGQDRSCIASCGDDEENEYNFVGQGRGKYEQTESYDFVGEGAGAYNKTVQTTYYGFRIKRCWLVLGLVGVVAYFGYRVFAGGVDPAKAVSDELSKISSALPDIHLPNVFGQEGGSHDCADGFDEWEVGWSDDKKTWCCQHMGKGCGHNYDCERDADTWDKSWSPEKKAYCCREKNLHCSMLGEPADGAASAVAGGTGCDAVCTIKQWTATCRSRIAWSRENHFKEDHTGSACWSAFHEVLGECTACTQCRGEEVGCSAQDEPPAPASPPAQPQPQPQTQPPQMQEVTSLPYDCDHGYANWKASWSLGKQTWCCMQKKRGCNVEE